MDGLFVHRGGEVITRDQLDLIKVPDATDSYVPVSHYALADRMRTMSQDILRDYTLVGENYAVARQGNQMFAVLKFRGGQGDLALSVAFRNSYDRSMAVGIAIGANVFCCDNLALSGEIVVMKKHTKNVWTELEDTAIATLYKSQHRFEQIVCDAEAFKALPVGNMEAFQLMGVLFGNDIISPRQLTTLKAEWLRPGHEEFQPRNMWSLYNAATESLKSSPPISIMEKHIQLHNTIQNLVN